MKFNQKYMDDEQIFVAPAWGRGLKSGLGFHRAGGSRRPRMGAWIEIIAQQGCRLIAKGRPRMGAWIEIRSRRPSTDPLSVAPAWGRGLKFWLLRDNQLESVVAPAWGRGLKFIRKHLMA